MSILARKEVKRMAEDQMRLQGLRTALVTMGTMTHQLANFLRGFSASVTSLREAVALKRVQVDADAQETLENMHLATGELEKLLEPMKTLTIVHSKSPCNLWEVIERARSLFQIDLEQRKTAFEILPGARSEELMIRVPTDVAILAISNLISNALDALVEGGRITLEVVERAHEVLCHVVDDGPGLPASMRSNLFELGVTTKETSGGWGLYLTRRSLIENQAKIELVRPGPGGTQFTIYFPKAGGD
ncbi:MAG: HAMP domain-containing histidine kinase [Thermoanaerobaculia bacterium]|nr:HAMP domain-containing histidine kinase [Thermoanaerobaculia bacterium]